MKATSPPARNSATRLGSLFTDHLVLQSGCANPIWGWDRPHQSIALCVEGMVQNVLYEATTVPSAAVTTANAAAATNA